GPPGLGFDFVAIQAPHLTPPSFAKTYFLYVLRSLFARAAHSLQVLPDPPKRNLPDGRFLFGPTRT
ncbi:MAG: hypothetical protein JW852_10770, partial [Spirochaetales bacterium]|nr:hypothetical protein [Spirochaetales bacterium]